MNKNRRTISIQRRCPQIGWFALLAALTLMPESRDVEAVDFSDGGTNTINDATYKEENIRVFNGTTLIIEPGAVIGGSRTGSGTIRLQDTSSAIINGGTFGG